MNRPSSTGARSRTSGRVLVAEDDAEMRALLVDVLTKEAHEVHACPDGVALLLELASEDGFQHDSFDLVVSDVRMPFCSGVQVLETLHAVRPRLPVVLLTAFGDAEMHQRVAQLGGIVLDKPVPAGVLCRVVGECIRAQREADR